MTDQRFLLPLLGYLERLYSSMEWDSGEEKSGPGRPDPDLPSRLDRILSDCGYLEGLHLKAQGYLSHDVQEFIRGISYAFEVEVNFQGAFKLPFLDNELILQKKTLNAFMEKAWLTYHAALLSAYSMRSLRFGKQAGSDPMEVAARVLEAVPGIAGNDAASGIPPAFHHLLNNALGGITSYVSLILEERKQDEDLQEKLGLVLESAMKIAGAAALPRNP
jgi:hypothetical protein